MTLLVRKIYYKNIVKKPIIASVPNIAEVMSVSSSDDFAVGKTAVELSPATNSANNKPIYCIGKLLQLPQQLYGEYLIGIG